MNELSPNRILVDKVRTGYDEEEAVGRTKITEETYERLGSLFRSIIDAGEKTHIEVRAGSWLKLVEPLKKSRGRAKEGNSLVTECYLVWCADDWSDDRRMFISLVRGSNQFFLNQDYNPAKFLTGQNAFGPNPDATWMGKAIDHTPPGYVILAYNLLGWFLAKAAQRIGGTFKIREWVDPESTMWSRLDLVDLVDMGSAESRDKMLRVLHCTTRLNVQATKAGKMKDLTLKYLFGIEALPVMDGKKESGAPTVTLKRWTPGNKMNQRNGKPAYTLNLYAKDVEMKDTGQEERLKRYPASYRKALETGIRIEIQLTPEAFKLPEVRKFCIEEGWVRKSMGDTHRVRAWLHEIFPDYKTYVERSSKLKRLLWKDSCFTLVMAPPDLEDIQAWADDQSKLMGFIVRTWIGDPHDPNLEALPRAQVFQRLYTSCGSRPQVQEAFEAFASFWKFTLNRVPPVTFPLLREKFDIGMSDNTIQVRMSTNYARLARNERLMLQAMEEGSSEAIEGYEAERERLEKIDTQIRRQIRTTANASRLEYMKLIRKLRPNSVAKIGVAPRVNDA